jgi:hypothetical protein
MNGRGIGDENTFSQAMARELGLRGVASSDAHKPDDVAVCATLFYDDIGDRWDLIRALKSGRFEPVRVDRFAPPDLKEALRAADFEPTPSNGQVPRNLEDIVRAV